MDELNYSGGWIDGLRKWIDKQIYFSRIDGGKFLMNGWMDEWIFSRKSLLKRSSSRVPLGFIRELKVLHVQK